MNNELSLEWLKEFVELTVSDIELARRLSLTGAGVEHVYPQGTGLNHIVVGKIVALEKHPNADSLHVCQVAYGEKIPAQIVCGGSNLFIGQLVALALVGARVKWHGEGELVEITNATLRGVASGGMICAASEIGLGELFSAAGDHEILDVSFLGATVKIGESIAAALGLLDTVFDIEATTNRPDLMSVRGVAREAVAAGAAKFKKRVEAKLPKIGGALVVEVEEKKLCPQYIGVQIDGVNVGVSPWWLVRRLNAAGVRPVNTIVDITNFVRLEMGQPMHAFDAERVNKKIVVRRAHDAELFLALDGSEHKLTHDMLVVADTDRPLAIAGVMGGKESGVFKTTTSVILEAAAFDSVSIRRTARTLNLYSDSQLLFEKGLSHAAPEFAMARAIELVLHLAGGKVVATKEAAIEKYKPRNLVFDFSTVEKFVGAKIPATEMKRILVSLGFVIKGVGTKVKIEIPWWRDHDIETPVDFIEEIARVYGYHNLPAHMPSGALTGRPVNAVLTHEKNVRNFFATHGFNETYTYSFVSEQMLEQSMMKKADIIKILNPLSSDFTCMRPSLTASMLTVIAENEPNFSVGKIFEVSNVYTPNSGERPREELRLCALVWAPQKNGEQFFDLKGVVEQLFCEWGIAHVFDSGTLTTNDLFHPGRTVQIKNVGILGEVHPIILKNFGITGRVALFDCSVEQLRLHQVHTKTFKPAPTFPPVKRDIALVVNEDVAYHSITELLETFDPKLSAFELFDVFRGGSLGVNKKSFAFHLTYSLFNRTLTAEEIDELHAKLIEALKRSCGAEIRL